MGRLLEFFNHKYPYTCFHELNADWLITAYKELIEEVDALDTWKTQHESDYEGLLQRVTLLENHVNGFIAEVDARFNSLQNELEAEIYSQIQSALGQFNIILGQMQAEITGIHQELEISIRNIKSECEAADQLLKDYIDVKFDELVASIPDLTTVNVYNPVRGEITSIQTAVNDLYDLGRSEGITAAEYDALDISADDYDALELTAFEYDQHARYYLEYYGFIKNPFHYMASPFTGEIVPLEVVINELAALHRTDALTASEYDNKELTATDYDTLDLSAYEYDWQGNLLIS